MATNDTKSPEPKSDKAASAPTKKKPFIVIYNNALGHRTLQLKGRIASTSKTHVAGPVIKLPVGATIVERRLWDQWKDENKDADIEGVPTRGQASILLEDRIPATMQRNEGEGQPYLEEGPEVENERHPLASLTDAEARGIINRVLDEGMLRRWLPLVGDRKGVAQAIADRIELFRKAEAAGKAGPIAS